MDFLRPHEQMFARTPDGLDAISSGSVGTIWDKWGALAKLDKAPVSKTGDSRFESWVPRSESRS